MQQLVDMKVDSKDAFSLVVRTPSGERQLELPIV